MQNPDKSGDLKKQDILGKLFGINNRNGLKTNILHYLQVGDSTFNTQANIIRSYGLTYSTSNGGLWKEEAGRGKLNDNYIECLFPNKTETNKTETQVEIKTLNETLEKGYAKEREEQFTEQTEFYSKIETILKDSKSLIKTINESTKAIIDEDIRLLEQYKSAKDFEVKVIENGKEVTKRQIEAYKKELEGIKDTINELPSEQCILRLGWGTGLLNMTGAWQEEILGEDWHTKVRPGYDGLIFPKTRRFTKSGEPFGFIKLTLQPE